MLTFGFGHWDYWNLYHKVTFDGDLRLIRINEGVTEIDVQRDIYSSWKEWLLLQTYSNKQYTEALGVVGGEPTIGEEFLDTTYFLLNGWKIKPQPGTYTLNIDGNIFDVAGAEIFKPAEVIEGQPNNININTNTSVIVRRLEHEVEVAALTQDESDSILNTNQIVQSMDIQLDNVENEIQNISGSVFSINNQLVEIKSIFEEPIKALLQGSQEDALFQIQQQVKDLWQIHGLDQLNPVSVRKDGRDVDEISQTFTESNGDVTIERNP